MSKDKISPLDVKQEAPHNLSLATPGQLSQNPARAITVKDSYPLPCTVGEISKLVYEAKHPEEADDGCY
jgi:hypothetical protein